MRRGALTGTRVLDLSRVLAGPTASQMLADLGADVVKVERPGKGDDARIYGPPFLKDKDGHELNESAMYLAANRNKRSIAVDIAKPEGQALIRKLAEDSDIVLENYKVGTLRKYGLDYESLRKLNPRLIYCSITGFGQTGPYRNRPGYDPIFQAMSGLMSVTGNADNVPGGGPMKVGPSIVDVIAGLYAGNAILAALCYRNSEGGTGQHIDISLLDCGIGALSQQGDHFLISGAPPIRRGSEGNGGVPGRTYRCADGDVYLSPGNDEQYNRLCDVLERPDLATDPRFVTNAKRVANRQVCYEAVEELVIRWKVKDLIDACDAREVPAAPIYDMAQVFADPQVQERELAREVTHPRAGKYRLVGSPLKFSETPITEYTAPPMIGQHTDEILAEKLGLGASEIAKLRSAGVVA